ncbi:helix-turn-helix transcriptional regulator [Brevibacterium yomogidense]|uniref:helix-turn-helix transcriptional regulator n=1 Tax=Brevibacterium yomogidense TaxID=946573 RepID=UPI0018DFC0C7|nr:LuxR C-terminal-related transcriptional regulator [Brevibacterium yomogidense]
MYVRSIAPDVVSANRHPAWKRFDASLHDADAMLVLHAPSGMGRGWFAQSWCDEHGGRVVHVRDTPPVRRSDAFTTAGSISAALTQTEDPPESGPSTEPRVAAIVLDSLDVDWEALADHDWRMALAADLLMSVDDIAEAVVALEHMKRGGNREDAAAVQDDAATLAARVHRHTGGWLEPTLILLQDPDALPRAQQVMLPYLSHWIIRLDGGWEMAKAAFLEPITDATLTEFFREVHGSPPSTGTFLDAGILVRGEDGTPFMPELVRSCLRTLIRQNDSALADDLVAAAVDAVAEATDLVSAIRYAASRRYWNVLGELLLERWTELFTADARIVRHVVEALPTAFIDQWLGDFSGAAVRLIQGAGPDGMSFVLPDGRVRYDRDRLAQTLHARTKDLYRNPGPKALSFGLLEVGYLRLAGHDAEAAAAARRLLTALHRAESKRRIHAVLSSVVNLHAGVALAIGGDPVTALSSFRAAFHRVEGSDHHFLLADTTSKLALITALNGDHHEARTWLAEHDRWIDGVAWGRTTVARSALLARVSVALADLDLEAADEALRALPPTPDQDETWQVHTYLLAMRSVLAGQPRRALVITSGMRHQRPHPSRTPLAQHVFAIAEHAAAVSNPLGAPTTGQPADPPSTPEIRVLESYRMFLTGEVDRAARLLGQLRLDELGTRWLNLALQMQILLDRHDKDAMIAELITGVVSGRGSLEDLGLLHQHDLLSSTHLQQLTPAQRSRLRTFAPRVSQCSARPTLTPREAEVLDGLRQGLSRREIAERQVRSENTVRSQIRSLYQKLGASSSEEALEAARRFGF